MPAETSILIHGTRYTYVKGCRCDKCKQANTVYWNKTVRRNRIAREAEIAKDGNPNPALRHGFSKTYKWHGCRCEDCTEAIRKEWREAKRLNALLDKLGIR